MKKPVSNRLFAQVKPMSDVKFSPNGTYIAYMEHQASVEENNYSAVLNIYDVKNQTTKELFPKCKVFTFIDDETVAVQAAGCDQIQSVSIATGKSEVIFQGLTVSKIHAYQSKLFVVAKIGQVPETEFMEFETLPIWHDGAKFTDPTSNAMFVINMATKQKKQITCSKLQFERFIATKDDHRLLYTGSYLNEYGVPGIYNRLYLYDMITDKTIELTHSNEFYYKHGVLCGDMLVFFGTDKKSFGRTEHGTFWIMDLADQSVKCLTPGWDHDVSNGISSDLRRGGEHYPAMIWTGKYFYFTALVNFAGNLYRGQLNGTIEQVTTIENGCVEGYDIVGDSMAYTKIDGDIPSELFLRQGGAEKQITHFNTEAIAQYEVMPAEHVVLKRTGLPDVDGWVIKPYGYQEGKTYPAIFNIHGGPMGAYGGNIYAEMQYMAARGYGVFFCNPRGSDGRGDEFGFLEKKICDIDYTDLMDFTKMVVSENAWIDSRNVMVTGGSYGGLMTNWIVGHTDYFRAAVTQRSISNYLTKILTTDIGFNNNLPQVCNDVWDDIETVWDKSPLKYAKNVTTPTMIIHQLTDYRCWLAEGVQFYTALKLNGVDTKLVLYKGESHGLTTGGRPQGRMHKMEKIVEWFDSHLAE